MQSFAIEERVEFPADEVLIVMMDQLPEMVPYLPSVDEIETLERKELEDGIVYLSYRWQGNSSAAPRVIRPFMTKASMAWRDEARWTPEEYKVEWVVHSNLSKLYECSGVNYFQPDPDDPDHATRIRLTGDVLVYEDKMPGVPRFLGRKIAPLVERFVVKRITPNLRDTVVGLADYLKKGGGK